MEPCNSFGVIIVEVVDLDHLEVASVCVKQDVLASDPVKIELAGLWDVNMGVPKLGCLFLVFVLIRFLLLVLLLVFSRGKQTRVIVSDGDKFMTDTWNISFDQKKLGSVDLAHVDLRFRLCTGCVYRFHYLDYN